MGDKCRIFGKVYGVLNIIGTIILAYLGGINNNYLLREPERNWVLTLIILVIGAFFTVFACIILFTVADIADTVEQIALNQRETTEKNNEQSSSATIDTRKQWRCYSCGCVNPIYVGTCRCGMNRSDN